MVRRSSERELPSDVYAISQKKPTDGLHEQVDLLFIETRGAIRRELGDATVLIGARGLGDAKTYDILGFYDPRDTRTVDDIRGRRELLELHGMPRGLEIITRRSLGRTIEARLEQAEAHYHWISDYEEGTGSLAEFSHID